MYRDTRRSGVGRIFWLISLTLSLATLVACTAGEGIVSPTLRVDRKEYAAKVDEIRQLRGDEEWLWSLSSDFPEFAGVKLEGTENVLVLATSDSAFNERRASISARLASVDGPSTRSARGLTFKSARYPFRELAAWRDTLAPALYSMRGWSGLDLNEGENFIDITVDASRSPTVIGEVEKLIADLGLPRSAIRLRAGPSPRCNQGAPTLFDRMRPLRGGLAFGVPSATSGGGQWCTLGPIALWGADTVVLVNSHCTERYRRMDVSSGWMRQPFWHDQYWGPELFDRRGVTCGKLNMYICRRAEVAAYATSGVDLQSGEVSRARLGEFVRPIEAVQPHEARIGSREIVPSGALIVAGTSEPVLQGAAIGRIGWATGWQTGHVLETCVDTNDPMDSGEPFAWNKFVCQTKASYKSDGGDSGGPVFVRLAGDSVLLAGIHWGSSGDWPTDVTPET